jgi:hypothetical protein
MGDAGAAAAQGPQAMYWNPALTADAGRFAANASYAAWFLNMSKSGLFVIRPMALFHLGFGASAFSAGQLEYRRDRPDEEPGGSFEPVDYSFYANLSRRLAPNVAFGLSGRFYYQKIMNRSAAGAGVDLGLLVSPADRLRLGLTLRDFAPSMKLWTREYAMPTRGVVGAVYSLAVGFGELSATADLGYGFPDRTMTLNAGAELLLNRVLALRAGYRALNQSKGMTLGIGLKAKGMRLEYAFGLHDNDLAATHRFALGFGY